MKIALISAFVFSALVLPAQDKIVIRRDTHIPYSHDLGNYSKRKLKKFRPLIFVDGKKKSLRQAQRFLSSKDTTQIEIELVNGKEAIDRYGKKGKNGVVLVRSKAPIH